MKKYIIAIALLSLSGCATRVSETLLDLPDLKEGPRINPIVKEFPLNDAWEVQKACSNLGTGNEHAYNLTATVSAIFLVWHRGCAWVPNDPGDDCLVFYRIGDEERREHELAHCHGYADTY